MGTDERVRLLDGVGLDWAPSLTRANITSPAWEASFKRLRAFKRKKGHANPPKRQGPLGSWASRMRVLYRKKQRGEETCLTDDQITRLESIGFQFPQMEA